MKRKAYAYILVTIMLITACFAGCTAEQGVLDGKWAEADPVDPAYPGTLVISGSSVKLEAWDESFEGTFSMEEYNGDCAEYQLVFNTGSTFPAENLLYHTETVDGRQIPVISMTMFEYDGRGLFVFTEFVREEDMQYLPEGFESETSLHLNGTDCETSADVNHGDME